jgi:5-bromo-4-chloroindolyl phosphate hydrolysis protein
MASREERMALNEAAARDINEEIEQAHQGEPAGRRISITCECALKSCDRRIDITMAEYQRVRSDPRRFAIVPEHFIGDIEAIVEENDRFAVVAKRQGTPADVAIEQDPRS